MDNSQVMTDLRQRMKSLDATLQSCFLDSYREYKRGNLWRADKLWEARRIASDEYDEVARLYYDFAERSIND